jgi:hypothetical protein
LEVVEVDVFLVWPAPAGRVMDEMVPVDELRVCRAIEGPEILDFLPMEGPLLVGSFVGVVLPRPVLGLWLSEASGGRVVTDRGGGRMLVPPLKDNGLVVLDVLARSG